MAERQFLHTLHVRYYRRFMFVGYEDLRNGDNLCNHSKLVALIIIYTQKGEKQKFSRVIKLYEEFWWCLIDVLFS